jgi:hypothetical protein
MREKLKTGKIKGSATRCGDCESFSPRRARRGIFLQGQWRFEGGRLVLRFSKSGGRNHWRFHRNRLPHQFARHGERGENRTNSCKSTTRHGSDALCRYTKFASPDICYANFYYLKFSDHGGGESDLSRGSASVYGRAVSHIFGLDAVEHQGRFFIKDTGTTNKINERSPGCSEASKTETNEQRDLSMNQLLSGAGYVL